MTRPRWTDDRALKMFVDEQIDDLTATVEYLDATTPGPLPSEPPELAMVAGLMQAAAARTWPDPPEREAVAAALRGDVEPLADLIRPVCHHPFDVDEVNPAIRTLSPATWDLIAEFATGRRNPKTGKPRGAPGAPKKSEEERRGITHVHDAADEVPVIVAILTRHYPDEKAEAVAGRAREIAAKRHRISVETLIKYLGRPREDRRRV